MFEVNPFVLQVLISNVPTVLTNGFIPILSSSFGTSLLSLGMFFFLMRIGNVVGSIISPLIHNKFAPHKIGIVAELLFFSTTSLILLAVFIKSIELFVVCAFFKGVIGGAISILRFAWLKQLPDFQKTSRLNLLANVLMQGSYCLVGIFLLIAPSLQMAKVVLVLDAIGSLFGAIIFWKMKKFSKITNKSKSNKYKEMFLSLISTPARKVILVTEILVCAGFGGTNIMLFKYGENFFGNEYGYAISLILYGSFYFIGGKIIELRNKGNMISLSIPLVLISLSIIILSLILLPISNSLPMKIVLFSLIFFCYPLISLQINSEWFKISKPHEAAGISAAGLIYSQIILGIFEIIYSFINYDNTIRALFLILAIFLVLFYSILKNAELKEIIN
ncbi:MFS transporter [Fluviispira multicolorata]|uniref:MFS transporter n=1 Tax=Fluviispira multicolorata TaxID=2654512 RepID=A0A833JDX0_9BACT|nr:MFS transporter [Fluviispira multicolorata]KAB8032098.1 MFS transporter [Fluviispira multicolorata]